MVMADGVTYRLSFHYFRPNIISDEKLKVLGVQFRLSVLIVLFLSQNNVNNETKEMLDENIETKYSPSRRRRSMESETKTGKGIRIISNECAKRVREKVSISREMVLTSACNQENGLHRDGHRREFNTVKMTKYHSVSWKRDKQWHNDLKF